MPEAHNLSAYSIDICRHTSRCIRWEITFFQKQSSKMVRGVRVMQHILFPEISRVINERTVMIKRMQYSFSRITIWCLSMLHDLSSNGIMLVNRYWVPAPLTFSHTFKQSSGTKPIVFVLTSVGHFRHCMKVLFLIKLARCFCTRKVQIGKLNSQVLFQYWCSILTSLRRSSS